MAATALALSYRASTAPSAILDKPSSDDANLGVFINASLLTDCLNFANVSIKTKTEFLVCGISCELSRFG